MSTLKPNVQKPAKEEGEPFSSAVVLFGGDGDKLFGSLGDVIGTLDDLLRDQLDIRGQA